MAMSSPKTPDEMHGHLQTRVSKIISSMLESSSISATPSKNPYFQSNQVHHPQYHDRVDDSLERSYLVDFSASW